MKPTKPLDWLFQFLNLGKGSGEPYEVLNVVQPVIDISREPWQIGVFNGDFIAGGGTNLVNLPNSQVNPTRWDTGRMRIWHNLGVSNSAWAVDGIITMFYEQNQLSTRRLTLSTRNRIQLGGDSFTGVIPMIGGSATMGNFFTDSAFLNRPIQTEWTGIAPVRTADPDRLVVALLNASGGETLTMRALFSEGLVSHPWG